MFAAQQMFIFFKRKTKLFLKPILTFSAFLTDHD